MNSFDRVGKELLAKGKNDVEEFANSKAGKEIGKLVDGNELRNAVLSGDNETLGRILNNIMSTDAGRELVKTVEDKFKNHSK